MIATLKDPGETSKRVWRSVYVPLRTAVPASVQGDEIPLARSPDARPRASHGLCPAPTLYRRRKQLMEHGIDIAVTPVVDALTTVPLSRYLESPTEVPQWARTAGLYVEPGCSTVRQESSVTDMPDDTTLLTPQPPDAPRRWSSILARGEVHAQRSRARAVSMR